jgi:hypothetical protein
MYKCTKCGGTMITPLDRCPHCGVLLSGVRCDNCKYIGSKTEYILNNHRCPKCGKNVYIPAASGNDGTPSTLKTIFLIILSIIIGGICIWLSIVFKNS